MKLFSILNPTLKSYYYLNFYKGILIGKLDRKISWQHVWLSTSTQKDNSNRH